MAGGLETPRIPEGGENMARPTLDGHRKFKRLVRDLGISKPLARGLLELLWDCANESGDPIFPTITDIEAVCEWDGEPGVLAQKLVDLSLVDVQSDGTYMIHDYWDHCPDYVRKRLKREEERKQKPRPDQSVTSQCSTNGGIRQNSAENGSTHTPTPTPTHTHKEITSCAEPLPRTAPAVAVDDSKRLLKFECVGPNPEWWLTESKLAEWQEAYPHLDVIGECRKAGQWLRDNPGRRKTARGMTKFLGGWLQRSQNSNRGINPLTATPQDFKTTDIGIKPDELIDIGGGIMCPFGKFKATADTIKKQTGKPDAECGALAMAELRKER